MGYLLISTLFNISYTFLSVITFLVGSYIIDVDGVISVFIIQRNKPEAVEIINAIKKFKIKEASTLGTKYHKKFNRLLLHNIVGFIFVITGFVISIWIGSHLKILFWGAVLFHFIFDIYDDFYQLKHLNNWFWPILKIKDILR